MRGVVELAEVVIGMAIVVFLFYLLFQLQPTPDLRPTETKIKVLNFLSTLENQGRLANLILSNNTTAILQELQTAFPSINFNVSIDESIYQLPNNTYSVVYFIPGNYTYFKPSKLTVYMWFL